MATAPAASFNLAKVALPVRVAIGAGIVFLVALTYWVMFYTAVSQRISVKPRTQTSQLNNGPRGAEAGAGQLLRRS